MMRRSRNGFTLIEVVLALSLIAAVLALAFGALRIGLGAWRRGEDRAETMERTRNLGLMLSRALAGTRAYRNQSRAGEQPSVIFRGGPSSVSFATATPPLPPATPIAFMAVTVSYDDAPRPGLVIRQKALPNFDPFEAVNPSLVDASVTAIRFRYLREEDGVWADSWEASGDTGLPRAVEVALTIGNGRTISPLPPFTVPLRAATP